MEEENTPVGSTAMEKLRMMTGGRQKVTFKSSRVFFNNDGQFHSRIFPQGGVGSSQWFLLGLELLNLILLIILIILGVNCAKVKQGSLAASNELNYLNHSKVTGSEEEAKKALESALKNHTQLRMQIEQQKATNDAYQRQIETLRTEKTSLQSNISFFERGCGKCLTPWMFYNSSCYFFSNLESVEVKKNWVESRADCVSRHADLAVIDNQEEQKFVSDTIKALKSNPSSWTNGFWVGLTDLEAEGTWVWINNVTEVEQRYWMDGEPNNHGLDGENCCITAYSSSNPWKTRYDGKCHLHNLHWLCEMPSS